MTVYTPDQVAETAGGNKYLGVLVAAKYARELNALSPGSSPYGSEKLTTQSLEAITSGEIEFRLVKRRRRP